VNKKFPSEDLARVKQSVKGLDFDCNKVEFSQQIFSESNFFFDCITNVAFKLYSIYLFQTTLLLYLHLYHLDLVQYDISSYLKTKLQNDYLLWFLHTDFTQM